LHNVEVLQSSAIVVENDRKTTIKKCGKAIHHLKITARVLV